MINMYIDESGSIHPTSEKLNRFFIIGIVIPKDSQKLRRVYKTFVRKNMNALRELDTAGRMFDKNNHFIALKGSSMNKSMKLDFINFFCQNNLFEVRYIVLDNNLLEDKFIKNKARTFNYLIKIFLINSIKKKYIVDNQIFLQIDERNVKTDSKYSLEDYLNQELLLNDNLIENVQVQYFDSSQNCFIQIADVFSNIMYSNLITQGGYEKELEQLQQKNTYCLHSFFQRKNLKTRLKKYNLHIIK